MAALPTVGGDIGAWGGELNSFLGVSLNADGTINPTAMAQIVTAVTAALNPPGYGTANKFTGTFTGDGTTTSFSVNHALGNSAPSASLFRGGQEVIPQLTITDAAHASFAFDTAPATGVVFTYTLIG